jgi:hypothetical protein
MRAGFPTTRQKRWHIIVHQRLSTTDCAFADGDPGVDRTESRTAKVVLMNLLITRDVEKGIGITKASVQL